MKYFKNCHLNAPLKRCTKSFDIKKIISDLNDKLLNTNHYFKSDSNVNKV